LLNEKKTMAFRFNTSYENANSFRDNVSSDRIYMNPSLAFKVGKKTDLLVEGDYLKDNRTADFGVGTINYEIPDIPRNSFIGIKWSSYRTEQKSATATITHHFNQRWQLKSVTSTQRYNNDLFSNVRPNNNSQFIKNDGTWVRGVQRTAINEVYGITQLDLTGRFSTGSIGHNLLVGADLDQYQTSTLAYNTINKYDSVNIYDVTKCAERKDIPVLTEKTTTKNPILRSGEHWFLTTNQWPYEHTRVHLLAIATYHAEQLQDLKPGSFDELQQHFTWAEEEFKIAAGGLAMRFGDTSRNGATVRHLHAHLIVPEVELGSDEKVRFKIS